MERISLCALTCMLGEGEEEDNGSDTITKLIRTSENTLLT